MVDNTEIIAGTGALERLTAADRQMLEKNRRKIGSTLCWILRHEPEMIGVSMNKQAWVNVRELIKRFNTCCQSQKFYLSLPVLMELVRTDNKQRYGLKGRGEALMIRCRQGHSIPWLEMDYRQESPPEVLYHGTVSIFLDSIMEQGLLPMSRQKVHLSMDIPTARSVARRRESEGKPVILLVEAARMAADGTVFYLADNDVWMADHVAPEYLSIL